MRKIAFINGSPKTGENCSLYLIDHISKELGDSFQEKLTVNALKLLSTSHIEQTFETLLSSDAIIVVFPLYVDSLPSNLLEVLENLDLYKKTRFFSNSPMPCLYGIANCGFIDSFQNINALRILENYSLSAGFKWCGGIGIGSGEMLRSTKDQMPMTSKINEPIYKALCTLTAHIKELEELPSKDKMIFGNQKFSQRLFILMGNLGWTKPAKANGITKRMLFAKPDLQ